MSAEVVRAWARARALGSLGMFASGRGPFGGCAKWREGYCDKNGAFIAGVWPERLARNNKHGLLPFSLVWGGGLVNRNSLGVLVLSWER